MTSKLRPAWAVAEDCNWEYEFQSEEEAAAVIEADREAVRALLLAEIERLRKLIEATSAHFLRLNIDHPIMWEGAIDAAMEAVCLEVERQAAELAKYKALAETLAGAMRRIHKTASHPTNPSRNLVDIKSVSDLALHKYDAALRQYKEARDA